MRLFILATSLVIVLFSCKKNKVEFSCDCSHLEGRFLTSYVKQIHDNSSSDSWYSDVVIQTKVDGNTLTAHGVSFEISSEDQTVFSKTDTQAGVDYTLTFSNNFQSVVLYIDGPNQTFGYSGDATYTGNTTTLLASSAPNTSSSEHPYKSDIEGEYLMMYTREAMSTGSESDTVYQDTFLVTMPGEGLIEINGTIMSFGQFHSYSSVYSNSSFNYGGSSKHINRNDDSLKISNWQFQTYPGAEDTSSVSYVGVKL